MPLSIIKAIFLDSRRNPAFCALSDLYDMPFRWYKKLCNASETPQPT
jgi:hypothetical protein